MWAKALHFWAVLHPNIPPTSYIRLCMHTQAHMYTPAHTHAHMYTHWHTRARTHTLTHTHAHVHMHMCTQPLFHFITLRPVMSTHLGPFLQMQFPSFYPNPIRTSGVCVTSEPSKYDCS